MDLAPGDDLGLEVHQDVDEFLRVESGQGKVQMGPAAGNLIHEWNARDGDAIFVPAGTWHNVTAVGAVHFKLYSISSPPEHLHGTVQTKKPDPE